MASLRYSHNNSFCDYGNRLFHAHCGVHGAVGQVLDCGKQPPSLKIVEHDAAAAAACSSCRWILSTLGIGVYCAM
jgi:hypothetical protein